MNLAPILNKGIIRDHCITSSAHWEATNIIFKPSDIVIFSVLFGVKPLLPNISPIYQRNYSVCRFTDILFIYIHKSIDIIFRGSYLRNKEPPYS
jgi:hypothetical protein